MSRWMGKITREWQEIKVEEGGKGEGYDGGREGEATEGGGYDGGRENHTNIIV